MVYLKTEIDFFFVNNFFIIFFFFLLEFIFELSSSSHFHKSNTGVQL